MYEAEITVGVPLITPVEASKASPVGSVEEMAHDVIVPPLVVGLSVVIAIPLVRVNELGEYERIGTVSLTTIVMVAVSLPPLFVPVTV